MEKKYQVFVSSTYEDLQEERKKVMEALLQMNCFPVGMEYFNASDSSQWEVIKSLIRECDYYVLIVAGRYGSVEEESGKSYTQKEFEYAIEQGVPVISFVHQHPEFLPGTKIEPEQSKRDKLEEFKFCVKKKLCKFWDNADGLAAQVVLSLTSLIKTNPRIGWVKANEISSIEANSEILKLRKENEEIKLYANLKDEIENLCQGNDEIKLKFYYDYKIKSFKKELIFTWNDIIRKLSPVLINGTKESIIAKILINYAKNKIIYESIHKDIDEINNVKISEDDFHSVKIQLMALGIIEVSNKKRSVKDTSTYWELTSYGKKAMVQLLAIRKI